MSTFGLNDTTQTWYSQVGPLKALIGTLLIGFVGTMSFRYFGEVQGAYLLRWKALTWGDGLALPIYALFAAFVLHNYLPSGQWYDQRWATALFMLFWLAFALVVQAAAASSRGLTWNDIFTASEAWHMIVVIPVIGTAITRSLIIAFKEVDGKWSYKSGMLASLGLYFLIISYDTFLSPSRSNPGR